MKKGTSGPSEEAVWVAVPDSEDASQRDMLNLAINMASPIADAVAAAARMTPGVCSTSDCRGGDHDQARMSHPHLPLPRLLPLSLYPAALSAGYTG